MSSNEVSSYYADGDAIRVVDGPFRGFLGSVAEALAERAEVKVEIAIGERTTRLWLAHKNVEPA